ncbi:hypothetical protein LSM04_003806 [Trypanosoma melophagium]|uniref:uncharacterized protein n=1 Tax=Trypanosoma melophagium TaxID=715481 RepID=UPI00351AB01D|nr:hypothetical protein LSM04_003806 [Trypanosoma melophagium]
MYRSSTPLNNYFSYRARLTVFYEMYAPAKVSLADTQLEKYRGRVEALMAALEQKYVHGNASGSTSTIVSGRVSPSSAAFAEDVQRRVYVNVAEEFCGEEATTREKLLKYCVEDLCEFCMLCESDERYLVERDGLVVFLFFEEEYRPLLLWIEESMDRPEIEHPSFPFMNENADLLEKFFVSLGTIIANGERLIDLEA